MNKTLPSLHKPAWLIALLFVLMSAATFAQPATYSVPFAIGRNNCAGSGGVDSVYFYNYASSVLTNSSMPQGCKPVLKTNYAPLSGYTGTNRPFTIFAASVSFNPKDQNMYYVYTDYNIPAPYKSYIWRWNPTTCPTAAAGLDTLRTFNFDIGGIAFDANGKAWQLEFSGAAPYKAYIRQLDFVTGAINGADTLDLIPGAGGIGANLYNVGSGDITITPDGQMYFIFDNKLYTPDYGSYDNPTHHLKCTYIDTVRRPTGATSLVGLAFADGDLIASYTGTCIYRKINPITGDTSALNYTYASAKGVRATDMSQINSGVGSAKKLVSVTPTGTALQYDVVYDVYVKNYGNTPIRNLQITDDLGAINGAANVSLNSVTMMSVPPPPGIALNAGYTGKGSGASIQLLQSSGQVLPAVPIDSNNFVIRISCRLSNILQGTIYNNQAYVTGNGFNNFALRDSSTNGNTPDLNTNDKPDDVGESQPTPFIVIITPSVPPCATLSQILYTQDFGTGVGLFNTLPPVPTASTTYAGTITAPLTNNRFSITDRAQRGDLTNWIPLNDNTPADVDGRMMIVNADAPAGYFYRDTLSNLCPNQQYSFSFYAAFIGNTTYSTLCDAFGGTVFPRVKCRVRDRATGLVITEASTATISNTGWQQFGIKWVMPSGYSNIIFELINDAAGGCGNDIAIDDIQFGVCSATPAAGLSTASSGCIGGSTTFTASLASAADSAVIPGVKDFEWQVSNDGISFTPIASSNNVNYVINPLTAGDVNKYYRVILAAQGNIGTPGCRYTSPALLLTAKPVSTPATSISTSRNNVCPGDPITLRLNGGSLGTGASWSWFTGSCGGTLVGTGTSITVNPLANTTYYVRANGDCGPTACVPIAIKVDCDIDDDNDGIPDVVESLGVDPLNDSDFDGLEDYRDPSYPGYVDANSDNINDNFDWDRDGIINELDLDSDNDGIPDVVEAYGVDANGDGVIDNYTDTDADGFSQNVDVNTSGHASSGAGLSIPDLDGDGIPNYFDLDSDNDGIPDIIEAGGTDANNNGLVDGVFTDTDLDGLQDALDGNISGSTPLLRTGADITSDGRADSYPNKNFDSDRRANPYDPDSDGDGIADVIEAGFPDVNLDGYVDAPYNTKGWATSIAARFSLGLRNTESVGSPDYLDIDADGDGIPDNIEGQTTNGYAFPAYADTDGDGLDNAYDNRPLGFGGSGIFVIDTDLDTTPDYRDLDTDADGLGDIVEGNDFNRNGFADDNVSLTGLDTDGDGLENRFDSSSATIKGTSYNMGTGGSTSGDAVPGSRTPVQKTNPIQTDRDWRYVGVVLPVQFLGFTGTVQSNLVPLSWSIITPKEIDHFEIERSTDNINYTKAGVNNQAVKLNESQGFGYTDNITGISNEILYYRLKVVGKNGEVKYSNILVLRRTKSNTTVAIMPNPASSYLSIRIYAERDADMDVRIIDNIGRTVLVKRQKVLKGNNTVQLNGLDKFSNGFYSLQLVNNNELITEKLIIQHK
jgi:Ig-like domain CHU_C associated/Secretion system C-terminal sorting domain